MYLRGWHHPGSCDHLLWSSPSVWWTSTPRILHLAGEFWNLNSTQLKVAEFGGPSSGQQILVTKPWASQLCILPWYDSSQNINTGFSTDHESKAGHDKGSWYSRELCTFLCINKTKQMFNSLHNETQIKIYGLTIKLSENSLKVLHSFPLSLTSHRDQIYRLSCLQNNTPKEKTKAG